MKKTIRLTESDLIRIVKRVLMEQVPLGGKTPFDPELDTNYTGTPQINPLDGFKIVDVSFPEYGLMGKRTEPTADIPKTLVGTVITPEDWISKGQIKLSNGKKELVILGDAKLGPKVLPKNQTGKITGATSLCKRPTTSGGKIHQDCTVFFKLNDNNKKYACDSEKCYER